MVNGNPGKRNDKICKLQKFTTTEFSKTEDGWQREQEALETYIQKRASLGMLFSCTVIEKIYKIVHSVKNYQEIQLNKVKKAIYR